ncbi:MAG: cyclic lactone autoinducer peptide [Ruminococcus sp.]|nr:cyclic lactone autoinducer peptide [Ruminococcus sp.]
MKKAVSKIANTVKKAAVAASKRSLNSACVWYQYQPKMPKSLKKD